MPDPLSGNRSGRLRDEHLSASWRELAKAHHQSGAIRACQTARGIGRSFDDHQPEPHRALCLKGNAVRQRGEAFLEASGGEGGNGLIAFGVDQPGKIGEKRFDIAYLIRRQQFAVGRSRERQHEKAGEKDATHESAT